MSPQTTRALSVLLLVLNVAMFLFLALLKSHLAFINLAAILVLSYGIVFSEMRS